MNIRVHKETYEQLCEYAYETKFCGALQDWLEEQGIVIQVHFVNKYIRIGGEIDWDINYDITDNPYDQLVQDRDDLSLYKGGRTPCKWRLRIQESGYFEGEIP